MTAGAILDALFDTFGPRLGFTLDGRTIDLRRAVVTANALRAERGEPKIAYRPALQSEAAD